MSKLAKVRKAQKAAYKAGRGYREGTVSLSRLHDALSAIARAIDALSPEELAELKRGA
jgi:hypothetical protein